MTPWVQIKDDRSTDTGLSLAVMVSFVLHGLVLVLLVLFSFEGKDSVSPEVPIVENPLQAILILTPPLSTPPKTSAVRPLTHPFAAKAPVITPVAPPVAPSVAPPVAPQIEPKLEPNSSESRQNSQSSESNDHQSLQAARPDYDLNPPPDYPMALREQSIGGVVWLQVLVDSNGLPTEIKLTKTSGYRLLDDSALRAVKQWRFIPGKIGNHRVSSWVKFPIRFVVNS